MKAQAAQVVDLKTGEITCPRCRNVDIDDLEVLERENTRLLRRIRALERDRDAERQGDPNRGIILALIERWKLATGHTRSKANAADRFDLVRSRLREGYTVADLELAIDGIGAFPYVINGQRVTEGKESQRHDRLGIALAGGESVERFANLGARTKVDRTQP